MPLPSAAPLPRITGICPPARAAVIAELIRGSPSATWIVVVEDARTAEAISEDTRFFHASPAPAGPGRKSEAAEFLVFPESIADGRDLREAFSASSERLNVLSRLRGRLTSPAAAQRAGPRVKSSVRGATRAASPALVVVTTPAALAQPVPAIEKFAAREITLLSGQAQPFSGLLQKLRDLDYDSEAVCEAPGQYAIRGGIIDVYPVTDTRPYRLDFFGDEIESIHAFDPVTQRSADPVDSISLAASPRVRIEPAGTGLADYLTPAARIVLVEPSFLAREAGSLEGPATGGLDALLAKCPAVVTLSQFDEENPYVPSKTGEVPWESESLVQSRHYPGGDLVAQERLEAENEARRQFLRQLETWRGEGYALVFVAAKEGEEQRMREILIEEGFGRGSEPHFLRGSLNEGFRADNRPAGSEAGGAIPAGFSLAPDSRGLVVVTETEVLGRQRPRRTAPDSRATVQRAQVDQLLDFSELVEGDPIVHLQHGIAIFRGLAKLDTAQGMREVISLEFDDGVTLHVPLSESHLLSRYVGLSKTRPQLGKIGSGRWEKARQAAERATLDLAAELLRIQAHREAQPGRAFGPDNAWQKEFEASFPFTETPDQLKAIRETKSDMERTRPMDRLICGDVGFGKTEVALRAAFKAVQDGRQVALLVPTTVLAQQHLNTFRERMAGYPIAVEMLSRFRTAADQKRVLKATAEGQVDILIGTHRLIQADVTFKDLGLVVIDEEQRFGVKHKEAFKRMRETVDVLSMSATPIPRTLYLAMTGARDLSVIETAPTNRHPIQTIVKTYEEKIVVEAIRHEIRRGGQVFYLHNRVATIDAVAARLQTLLPELSIGVGHGKMESQSLERVMTDFVAGQYQVLVCTTIIESGLDIPNCNTIIIEGADRFGLSQLYQLRGRVGRFKHQAYAYLLLHRHTRLLDIARQRLSALRQHNQLGAGFRIAMRDLELRGAGNLLGAEQSGHIVGVGFELYCQLLRQSVARLKGEKGAASVRASVKLDFVFTGETSVPDKPGRGRRDDGYTAIKDAEDLSDGAEPVSAIQARIPATYVGETRLRIDLYRRLALAPGLPQLRGIEDELKDRFGKFGDEVRALLLTTEIRIRAEQKGILSVESESHRLKCLRNSGTRDDWVMPGSRFPRLTAAEPLLRLREILIFLNNLPNP